MSITLPVSLFCAQICLSGLWPELSAIQLEETSALVLKSWITVGGLDPRSSGNRQYEKNAIRPVDHHFNLSHNVTQVVDEVNSAGAVRGEARILVHLIRAGEPSTGISEQHEQLWTGPAEQLQPRNSGAIATEYELILGAEATIQLYIDGAGYEVQQRRRGDNNRLPISPPFLHF